MQRSKKSTLQSTLFSQFIVSLKTAGLSEDDINIIRHLANEKESICYMTTAEAVQFINDIHEIEDMVFKNKQGEDAKFSLAVIVNMLSFTRAIDISSNSIHKLKTLLQKANQRQDFFYLEFIEEILAKNNGIVTLKKIINHFALLQNEIKMIPEEILSLCDHVDSWSELKALINYYLTLVNQPYQLTRRRILTILHNDKGHERIKLFFTAERYIRHHGKAVDLPQLLKQACVSLKTQKKSANQFILAVETYVNAVCPSKNGEKFVYDKREHATAKKKKNKAAVKRRKTVRTKFTKRKKHKYAALPDDKSSQTTAEDAIVSPSALPTPQNNDHAVTSHEQPVTQQSLSLFSSHSSTLMYPREKNNLPVISIETEPVNSAQACQFFRPCTSSLMLTHLTNNASYHLPVEPMENDDLFSVCSPILFPHLQHQPSPAQIPNEKSGRNAYIQVPGILFFQPSQRETQDDRQIPTHAFF